MNAARILNGLLIAVLFNCASASAGDAIGPAQGDRSTASSFKISELHCDYIEGQVRCTFGG
jgi:hypothetical protein